MKIMIQLVALFSLALGSISCQSTNELDSRVAVHESLKVRLQSVQVKLDRGKAFEASMLLEGILKSYPDHVRVLTMQGLTDVALKNNLRAIQMFERAYEIYPSAEQALNMSSAYIATKDFKTANSWLEKALRHHEEEPYRKVERIHHNLGYIAQTLGNAKKAEYHYKRALFHSPSYLLSIKQLARLYESTGQPSKALEIYERFHILCQACYLPISKLTRAYIKQGKTSKATQLLNKFLDNKIALKEDKTRASKLLRKLSPHARKKTQPAPQNQRRDKRRF